MINQKMRISLLGFLGTREGTVPMGRDNSGSLRVLVNRATVQVLAKKNVGNVKNTIKRIKKIKEIKHRVEVKNLVLEKNRGIHEIGKMIEGTGRRVTETWIEKEATEEGIEDDSF